MFEVIGELFSYFIYCLLHVNVWCVENEQFEGFSEGEDFEYSEQFPDFVEGKCPWSYPLYPI
jgi:hypothetical protein